MIIHYRNCTLGEGNQAFLVLIHQLLDKRVGGGCGKLFGVRKPKNKAKGEEGSSSSISKKQKFE